MDKQTEMHSGKMIINDGRDVLRKLEDVWFPKDRKTCNLLVCALSVSLSAINIGLSMSHMVYDAPSYLNHAWTVIAAFCAYELYQGLNDELPPKFFYWFLLKFAETALQVGSFFPFVTTYNMSYRKYELAGTLVVFAAHAYLVYYIVGIAKKAERSFVSERQPVDMGEIMIKNDLIDSKPIN